MKQLLQMASVKVLVRGGGDLASGVAWRLHQSGFRVVITEIPEPLSVRRKVAFSEAVYEGQCAVEGVQAVLVKGPEEAAGVWNQGFIPVLVDPEAACRHHAGWRTTPAGRRCHGAVGSGSLRAYPGGGAWFW